MSEKYEFIDAEYATLPAEGEAPAVVQMCGSPYLTGVPQVALPCPDRSERHRQLRCPGRRFG